MAKDFPNSPTNGQQVTFNGTVYEYNSTTTTWDTVEGSMFSSVGEHIIPSTDNTYDLGSSTNKWRSLYVDAGTIHIGNQTIKSTATGIEMPSIEIGTGDNKVKLEFDSTSGGMKQTGRLAGSDQPTVKTFTESNLGSLSTHIIPSSSGNVDLGHSSYPFRNLYLSDSSLHLGDKHVTASDILDFDTTVQEEVLALQVASPDDGDGHRWVWTWLTSSLPYARAPITNQVQLTVPLYKQGTYTLNNFANTQYGSMSQRHDFFIKWIEGYGTQNNISWATYSTKSATHASINSGIATTVQLINIDVPATVTPPSLTAPLVSYSVTAGSGVYTFSGGNTGNNPDIGPFYRGGTYTVNINATGHPFYFTTDNGTNFVAGTYAGEYTKGVTGSRSDTGTITFIVPNDAPSTLYYQCGNHSTMRGSIRVKDLAVETNEDGNYIVYGQHLSEGHSNKIEIRPIPSLTSQMCLVYDQTSSKFIIQDMATYVDNTPSFKNKIKEIAGTAELIAPDGSSLVASVAIYTTATYLPAAGNTVGDIAFVEDTSKLYIYKSSTVGWIETIAAVDTSGLAAKASPTFTGVPSAPTASTGTSTTQIATTEFVYSATSSFATSSNVNAKAEKVSPTFTGVPSAPTASTGTNTTQIATTEFVTSAVAGIDFSSTALSGIPTAPTAASLTNTTQIATTAFVTSAIDSLIDTAPGNLDTLNELAAAISDDANYAAGITTLLGTKAPIVDPVFTGVPIAPTPSTSTNDTQLATTAFVRSAISAYGASGASTASVALSDTAPSAPTAGAIWWDTSEATPYVYYADGDSSQWVPFAATGAKGPQGSIGLTGPTGPTGVAVTSGSIVGDNLVLALSNSTTSNVGNVRGPIGPTGPTGPGYTNVSISGGQLTFTKTDASTQVLSAVGPTGPIGATGATGAAGVAGPTGAAGPTGPSFTSQMQMQQQGVLKLLTGTARWYAYNTLNITGIIARVITAGSGNITIVVKKNGISAKTLIISSGATSATHGSPSFSMSEGDYLTIDITTLDTNDPGTNLSVLFKYTQ